MDRYTLVIGGQSLSVGKSGALTKRSKELKLASITDILHCFLQSTTSQRSCRELIERGVRVRYDRLSLKVVDKRYGRGTTGIPAEIVIAERGTRGDTPELTAGMDDRFTTDRGCRTGVYDPHIDTFEKLNESLGIGDLPLRKVVYNLDAFRLKKVRDLLCLPIDHLGIRNTFL